MGGFVTQRDTAVVEAQPRREAVGREINDLGEEVQAIQIVVTAGSGIVVIDRRPVGLAPQTVMVPVTPQGYTCRADLSLGAVRGQRCHGSLNDGERSFGND